MLQRYLAGELSAPLALMHLVIAVPEPDAVEAAVARLLAASAGIEAHERARQLATLLAQERGRIAAICRLWRDGIDHERIPATAAEGIDTCRALFDRLDWRLVAPGVRVLDLGCGIGRVAAALAPEVASVIGLDLSPR